MGSPFRRCQAHSFCCLFLPDKTEEDVRDRSQSCTVCLRLWPGEVRGAWARRESRAGTSQPRVNLDCRARGAWGEWGLPSVLLACAPCTVIFSVT